MKKNKRGNKKWSQKVEKNKEKIIILRVRKKIC